MKTRDLVFLNEDKIFCLRRGRESQLRLFNETELFLTLIDTFQVSKQEKFDHWRESRHREIFVADDDIQFNVKDLKTKS